MNMHEGARLTPRNRELPVNRVNAQGQPIPEVAQAMGVSVRTNICGHA
jgi:hypothetical protein